MFIVFDILFLLYSLIYLPYLILTKRWHKDFLGRFGFFPKNLEVAIAKNKNVWIHAVSVGEVMAVEGFIKQLKLKRPDLSIVCTVTTKTGYELAKQRFAQLADVLPSPLDFSFTVNAFIDIINPRAYIVAETEIWPNLFYRLHARGIPIAIINGRISDRSYRRYQKIKFLLKPILNCVTIFAMQSALDAERIKTLGAEVGRVFDTGNLKFDDTLIPKSPARDQKKDFLLFVAGSTHPGEEKIILDMFIKLRLRLTQWRLMLAPRHIERVTEIEHLLKEARVSCIKLSQCKDINLMKEQVVIVDTLGQLRRLYQYADLVFVGKSLCVGGGHNIIEPAFYGKAIIVGPMMGNFKDITACFKSDEAIIQVENPEEFKNTVSFLMKNPDQREVLGIKARAVIDRNQGAVQRTLTLVQSCL